MTLRDRRRPPAGTMSQTAARWRTLLPVVLVLVSLSALAVAPLMTLYRTEALREHIESVAEPARAFVAEIRNAIALESAATRGFVLTGDSETVAHHLRARASRDQAIQELRGLAQGLGPDVQAASHALTMQLQRTEPVLDSLFDETITRQSYLGDLATHQERLQSVLVAASGVERAIGTEVTATLAEVRAVQAIGAAFTILFVLLALISAILVANLTRRFSESEERFRQIAEALHDCVWLSDTGFTKYLFVNAAYERIWGRSRAELYANPLAFLDGVHRDDRERVRAALGRLPEGTYDIEFRVLRPDGELRWVWSRGFPVRSPRGDIYRIAGITEDVTERKVAGESRVRLIRGFTHDVKNPLGAADGFLSLLQDETLGSLSAKQLESVGRVRRSIRSALNLIGHLLEIAKAEAGQLEIRRAPLDLAETTRETVEDFRADAEAKGLAVSFERSANQPLIVESDQARVRQILANLLSNAVKYTPSGGRIAVRALPVANGGAPDVGDWAAVEVCDTGPGIPTDKMNLLFREFTRFDPGAADGSGIGLAISQRLARALDAIITVSSHPGVGSIFTLWLRGEQPPPRS